MVCGSVLSKTCKLKNYPREATLDTFPEPSPTLRDKQPSNLRALEGAQGGGQKQGLEQIL